MKLIFFCVFTFAFLQLAISQDEVKLSDLKTPNSPGFQLLDISPSSIDRPANPKEFSLKVLNLFNNGISIPKNFAIETSPFWYFKPKKETVYKYLNTDDKKDTSLIKTKFTSGFLRKANFSFASIFSDSGTSTLLKNTNYVSFGIKTNLITIRTKDQNKKIVPAILAASKRIDNFQGGTDDLETIEKKLNNDSAYQENIARISKLPLLQLDAAYAYSNAFSSNKFENRRFNRSAIWGTLAINADFSNGRYKNHSLSFISSVKYLKDNALVDTLTSRYTKVDALDFGGKLDYNIGKFNLSIEYLKRTSDLNKVRGERTVGFLQYKINDNLYISATYGKNFGSTNNLFTLLGLNWGFGNSALSTETKTQTPQE